MGMMGLDYGQFLENQLSMDPRFLVDYGEAGTDFTLYRDPNYGFNAAAAAGVPMDGQGKAPYLKWLADKYIKDQGYSNWQDWFTKDPSNQKARDFGAHINPATGQIDVMNYDGSEWQNGWSGPLTLAAMALTAGALGPEVGAAGTGVAEGAAPIAGSMPFGESGILAAEAAPTVGGTAGTTAATAGGNVFDLFDPSTWGIANPEEFNLASQTGANLTGGAPQTFLDNWDMLPDTFNTYQTPSVMDLGQFTNSPGLLDSIKQLLTGNNLPPGTSTLLQKLLGGSGGLGGLGGIGGLLGALAGGLGANQKPAGTTTTVQDIPDYLKPYQSMNLASGVNNFNAAGMGSALLPGALDQMGKTISGQYLDPNTNPAFQPYAKDLMGNALSVFNGQYGGSAGGGINNSGFQEGAARAITNAALPLYNNAYQTERSNQVNAASQAPGFASNYAGAALAPNLAFKNLYTGPQATSTPYFSNPFGGALSGGLAGMTLGNAFGK